MSELSLKNRVVKMIKNEFPEVFFYKAADAFTAGIPDIIGAKEGKFFAVELKFGKGKTTRLQDYVIEKIHKSGSGAIVARDVETVRAFLKSL